MVKAVLTSNGVITTSFSFPSISAQLQGLTDNSQSSMGTRFWWKKGLYLR
jgi:hypothetical protein